MTNIADTSEPTKRPFGLHWMPHFRIAIPTLSRRVHLKRAMVSSNTLERDELAELFEADLSGLRCLNLMKERKNVVHLETARSRTHFGVGRSSKTISGRSTQRVL